MSRRLAAILSMDVVGYSALMEQDETATLAALNTIRSGLIDPLVSAHGGEIVKLMGDGALMIFASAVDAVRFAVAAQLAIRRRHKADPSSCPLVFRIGINVGDVITQGDDIHGEGVNLAARLEALADPGGICIHRTVRDQVRDRLALDFRDRGETKVKNIQRPVRAFDVVLDARAEALANSTMAPSPRPALQDRRLSHYLVAAAALLIVASLLWLPPWQDSAKAVPPDFSDATPSIIVLPFANLSGNPEKDYLAEGFSTAVRTELSKFPQLFVIAGSTAATFGDSPLQASEIGRELGVRYVLAGSMQGDNDRITVNAELVETDRNRTAWAEQYGFAAQQMITVQTDVVQEIVATLQGVIESEEIEALRRKPTHDPKAYDLYLQAVAANKRITREGRSEAIRLLNAALELDPDYLAAHSELSGRYLSRWRFDGSEDADEDLRLARFHAEKILELDQADYRGHYRLGSLHLYAEHDHDLAYAAYARALRYNPNDADLLYSMGFLRSLMGAPAEAIEWNNKAKEINPRYPGWYNFNPALSHFFLEEYDTALALARTGIAAYPRSLAPRRILIVTLVGMGRLEEAREEAAKLLEISPDFRLSTFRNTPFQHQKDQDRYFNAMRAAGLPD